MQTVSELTASLKNLLEDSFRDVTLQGEISNFKIHTSGHCYFSLKDTTAQIQAVMFRSKAAGLKIIPKEGDSVIVKGQISVYEQRGQYQIIVSEMKPLGLGALLAKLEELKKFYASKGYFDKSHKKSLPPFPKRVGVITSQTGAVIHDIIQILKRRAGSFSLILNPVKVQGEGAALEIAAAIDQMNTYLLCDVMIIGRGGGSIEDLWAFNEAPVIEAIYRSQIPIISAVGHETDFTLSDMVADLRAPTPSAAAEIIIKERSSLLQELNNISSQLDSHVIQLIHFLKRILSHTIKHPFIQSQESLLGKYFQRVDEIAFKLTKDITKKLYLSKLDLSKKTALLEELKPQVRLQKQQKELLQLTLIIDQKMLLKLSQRQQLLEKYRSSFIAMNPKSILKRGYCLLFANNQLILSSIGHTSGEPIKAELADGTLHLHVH